MDYDTAMQSTVTALEARREIINHHRSWVDFLEECGCYAFYSGETVLAWLGY